MTTATVNTLFHYFNKRLILPKQRPNNDQIHRLKYLGATETHKTNPEYRLTADLSSIMPLVH
ncbi:MAG: hypothetical protein COA42_14950 [Alteromonadaceae bacterium]|nr:MAG: hypothetical protein COA42_14950 [Alteromonadaceae bacterium]